MLFDMPIVCSVINSNRATDPRTCDSYTTAREIWSKAPRAAARKATAPGVNGLCIDEAGGRFRIFQISGYTPERGLFCDQIDEAGRVIATL